MFFADSGNHRNVFGGFRETRRVTGLQAFHNFTRGIKRINKWNWTGRRLRRLVRVAVIISNAVERLRLCIHNQNQSAIVPLNMSEESIGSFFRWNDRPIKRAVKKIPAQSTHANHAGHLRTESPCSKPRCDLRTLNNHWVSAYHWDNNRGVNFPVSDATKLTFAFRWSRRSTNFSTSLLPLAGQFSQNGSVRAKIRYGRRQHGRRLNGQQQECRSTANLEIPSQ